MKSECETTTCRISVIKSSGVAAFTNLDWARARHAEYFMADKASRMELPDWWQREKQRRLLRVLIFLGCVVGLIAYYYYLSANGLTGVVSGVNFDTKNYVAFVRDDGKGHTDLYAIKTDGTGLRRLTSESDNSTKSHPVWTLEGKSLLYAANLEDSHITQIYMLGNGQPVRLTYGTGNKSWPVISPDGQHAAFISQGAIKSVYLNGKDVEQLMPQPRNSNATGASESGQVLAELQGPFLNASFSSDGSGIAGVQDCTDESSAQTSDRIGIENVVSCIPPGGGPTIQLNSGRELSIAWEKAGNRIACSFTELHAPNKAVMNDPSATASYKDWQNLTKQDKDTTLVSGIQIFTFTGKKPTSQNVFTGLGYSIEPKNIAWSPDSNRMAFEGWRLTGENERELSGIAVQVLNTDAATNGVVVDPQHMDGFQYIVQSSADGKPQNPRWSPDSQHLLFEMLRPDGKRDLWSINADGTNKLNLTKGVGDNFDASWAPTK